ncbi:MAG: FHA domain-containing protein [Acidimicrobiales bacterium]
MSASLLAILKYFLIALLWLFFLRVLRVAWLQMSEPRRQTDLDQPLPATANVAQRMPPTPPAMPGPPIPSPVADRVSGPASSLSPSPGHLRIVDPQGGPGRVFEIRDELVMGRSSECGVALPGDSFVSNRHVRLYRNGDGVWAEDLGSTNGTYINAQRIDGTRRLSVGDRLQVGRTTLEAAT